MQLLRLSPCLLAALAALTPAAARADEVHGLIVAVSEFTDPALAPYALAGARADANAMRAAFDVFAGEKAQVVVLEGTKATLARVRSELRHLTESAMPGQRIVLYFSAHGSRIPDTGPRDEDDGEDEVLLMADAAEWRDGALPGALIDDELAAAVRAMRERGADVFLAIDSCASGGAMRGAEAMAVRNLSPEVLGVPSRAMRSALRRDAAWVEDDMPAGSGRLVTLAAGPTGDAAWDTPEGGLFTRSLARALASSPADFVELVREQRRQQASSALPGPASEAGGAIESAFFFAGNLPDLVASARAMPLPDWTLDLHSAAAPLCDMQAASPPRLRDPTQRLHLGHCDAVMLSLAAPEPGFVDAWYIDSARGRTLLSPIGGLYLDGRSPTHLDFTFVSHDPASGAPYPAGTDRLLLFWRKGRAAADHAAIIEFAVRD
ncbi:caspase family protein [Aurantiacibacter flavus]|uniref:Caspase family protein n=1 Tax=Aurantiacibacter flavus TaxID=3145232 RepID=A0ABV0CSN3_9SPHN